MSVRVLVGLYVRLMLSFLIAYIFCMYAKTLICVLTCRVLQMA